MVVLEFSLVVATVVLFAIIDKYVVVCEKV